MTPALVETAPGSAQVDADRHTGWSLLLVTAASGFAGLGYQIVWTQQGALWLGHEAAAVLAVVAAYFGGLAIGALSMARPIERSRFPARWYAACEVVIGVWGLVLVVAMAPFSDWMLVLTGVQPTAARQWTVAFCGMFVLLLPATAAMGATLPAMERVMSRRHGRGRSLAACYASNTVGATVGVVATAFWLIPSLGLLRTTVACAALNLLCAAVVLRLAVPADAPLAAPVRLRAGDGPKRWSIAAALAWTGLLGIGYEVLVVRVLSQVCEDTVYTLAMLLAVYLVGSAAGAAAYHRWSRRHGAGDDADHRRLRDRLACALAVACLAGIGSLWAAESVRTSIGGWGDGVPIAIGAEAALALAAFGLPTVVMGALFSHLATGAQAAGMAFGRSLGINIVGAAAAPIVFGVLISPALGPKLPLLAIVAGYLALLSRRGWSKPAAWWPAALVPIVAFAAPPLAFVDVPAGGRLVAYREGAMAAVSVVEDADGVSRLRIDNREQEGSSATRLVDGRQALLPLLLASSPRRALFLGLGTGITAATAAEATDLEVDAVELLPDVIAASSHFTRVFDGGLSNPRLHPIAADARRYVRTTPLRYGLIVADNFHPARGGSGALYTVEHFAAVRGRLEGDGLFCQWLPLHQLDLETLRSIVRSFVAVFPDGWALLASNGLGTPVVGLVGRRDGRRFDLAALQGRLAGVAGRADHAAYGIDDQYALLGAFIAGPASLAGFAGDATTNTDDRPIVAYRAPLATYAPRSLPQNRLVGLLGAVSIRPDELLSDPNAAAATRLAAYWMARDRFIAAGRGVRPSADVGRMLAQVRGPLLEVLRISPDFRPAYDPLLRMATALARSDRAGAKSLLADLATVQPARQEARQALERIDRDTAGDDRTR